MVISVCDGEMKLELVLPLPVSINQLYINQYGWNPKTKSRMPTGKLIMCKEGEKVKKQIQDQATKQMQGQTWDYEYTKENYVYQDSYIYMNRLGRDDSNIYKLLNDSLEKIVYENDSRVLTRTQRLLIDSGNPRVEVILTPVPFKGIFPSQEHLDIFVENCRNCGRFTRNCSILNKATEGRIQEEIILEDRSYICSKYKQKKE